jgi:hypothetical protein
LALATNNVETFLAFPGFELSRISIRTGNVSWQEGNARISLVLLDDLGDTTVLGTRDGRNDLVATRIY